MRIAGHIGQMNFEGSSKTGADLPKVMLSGAQENVPKAFTESCLAKLNGHAELLPGVLGIESDLGGSLGEKLAETDYLLGTWGVPPLDARLLDAAPKLKGVFYAAGSVKGFATPLAYERGIVISSAWRANALPVAEFTLGAILLGLKRVFSYSSRLRETKAWVHALDVPGGYRSTVGLISLGAVGRRVANLLSHFEIRVIAYDPYVSDDAMRAAGVEPAKLDEIFATADVVSVHTPWIPETVGMVNARLLRQLKPGATFINTSRGAVINEQELIDVLGERPDVTAMLDVTYPEPPEQQSPLWTLPNVVLTPHIAGSMGPEVARMGEWMVAELLRQIAGQPLEQVVSQEMVSHMA